MLQCKKSFLTNSVTVYKQKSRFINNVLPSLQCKNYSSDNERYLHKSRVPTMHFQPSLPRLPIPRLEDTCQRYLNAQLPLLDATHFEDTKRLVANFQSEAGKDLNQRLVAQDKANKHTSYITGSWFDMYLRDRQPIVLNYNPFISYIDDPKTAYNDQTIRAANFLISAIRFRETLNAGLLEPEVYHLNSKKSDTDTFRKVVRMLPSSLSWYGAYLYNAYPLDMSQYPSLFNSTRVPEIGKDRLVRFEKAKHVLVMRGGHFYVFDVLDKDGNLLEPLDIYSCLKYIQQDPIAPSQHPIGYLTAENRDTWANARQLLMENNSGQMEDIDSALFNLVLDDVGTDNDPVKISKLFLHGNGANRWFDKSFSLIVARDGKAAVNFEHSWGDGVAVMRFLNESFKDSTGKPRVHPDEVAGMVPRRDFDPSYHVKRLEFKLSDRLKAAVSDARQRFDQTTGALTVDLFIYNGFSKHFCKEQQVSPDAMMQLGFQVAYQLQNGGTCSTYESCSTSAFKHGRTETIRPCTSQTTAFSRAITASSGKHTQSELRAMITDCSKVHGQLTKEAAMGQGFDRHLFALKYLAQQQSLPIPALYQDPAYAAINHNILSTSTLGSPAVELGGFAPVAHDGYGIGYSIQDNRLGAVVTTYPPHRNGSDFVSCLESAFRRIEDVLRKKN
ncbi:carnitine O-palmitoyltransferase 2, mitochondrial [Daphnia magna]|uniref:carnitine O-palmitoyltransferase 2, mitochondrial n=1 Tax=Daphnia magna TaxID=35525 RepID=UPI001E1BB3F7|nr:carnitine O-palmitoyltransferase 2, mitochondrial [Daphnia magna]